MLLNAPITVRKSYLGELEEDSGKGRLDGLSYLAKPEDTSGEDKSEGQIGACEAGGNQGGVRIEVPTQRPNEP